MYGVVILSKSIANLRPCVEAIRRHEHDLPTENIVVVDDDESGRIAEFCEAHVLTLVQGEKPFIFARNANIGLRAAFERSDAVVLLNDDAMLETPGGFSRLHELIQKQRKYGILASSVDSAGNANQWRSAHPSAEIRHEPRMLCFIAVMISREAWRRTGELDERFIGYGLDDDDYCLRVRKAGMRLGVVDQCFVNHSKLKSTFRGEGGGDFSGNMRLFIEKWGHDNHGRTAKAKPA